MELGPDVGYKGESVQAGEAVGLTCHVLGQKIINSLPFFTFPFQALIWYRKLHEWTQFFTPHCVYALCRVTWQFFF